MFLTLLGKECSQYFKSITYYIFLFCLVIDYISQMGVFEVPVKPEPGQEYYGMVRSEDEDLVMQDALELLIGRYEVNEYITYPVGFYKKVILNEKEQEQIKESILYISGLTEDELISVYDEAHRVYEELLQQAQQEERMLMGNEFPGYQVTPRSDLTFAEFKKEMKKVDEILGGGSDFSEANLRYTYVPSTYEQAMEEYQSLLDKDKVTNAYARLFCDYMGIMLAVLPVFLAVTRALRDRKAQAEQVIFMRRAGSTVIVLSRYMAALFVTLVPVLILSCFTLVPAVYYAKRVGAAYDLLAFVKYTGFWLIPTILISLSVGFFITELTDSALAVLAQIAWWFVSIFLSTGDLVGSVGWNLVPRFNAVGEYTVYEQMRQQLIKNRCFYAVFACLLLVAAIVLFSKKRKGAFTGVGTILRNRKG